MEIEGWRRGEGGVRGRGRGRKRDGMEQRRKVKYRECKDDRSDTVR